MRLVVAFIVFWLIVLSTQGIVYAHNLEYARNRVIEVLAIKEIRATKVIWSTGCEHDFAFTWEGSKEDVVLSGTACTDGQFVHIVYVAQPEEQVPSKH